MALLSQIQCSDERDWENDDGHSWMPMAWTEVHYVRLLLLAMITYGGSVFERNMLFL